MSCSFRVFRIGLGKILRFDCEECNFCPLPEPSDMCLRGMMKALWEHPDAEELVLPGPLEGIYTGKALSGLKQLAEAFEKCQILATAKPANCERWEEIRKELLEIVELIPAKPLLALKEARGRKNHHFCTKVLSERLDSICGFLEECLPPKGIGIQPPLLRAFSGARLSPNPPQGELVESYQISGTEVRIYRLPDLQHLYFLMPPEFSLSPQKVCLLGKIQERLLSLHLEDPFPSRELLRRRIEALILEYAAEGEIELEEEEEERLTSILLRHTVGLGLLELPLSDPWVQDLYADAPLGLSPVHLYHRHYEECITNLYLSPAVAESLVSKFRALSGRPFSEADPELELEWEGTRVTVVGSPLSPEGTAFSFRKHKSTPWTLPQFVAVGFLPPTAASLLSLAVDAHCCLLITGSRGSGKTSLLGSLLPELHPKSRILVVEDTPELPVDRLRELGFKIQTLGTKPPLSTSQTELTAEDVLRTVLRMGESVLVIGEVRGGEAKVLFEAMRIGAVGNSVLGTIHASSSADVLDRIVHDLHIPENSFKSTDLIVCVGPVRKKGSLSRRRRLLQLTEVRKSSGLALRDLIQYDYLKDRFIVSLEGSELLSRISRHWGMGAEELEELVRLRTEMFEILVETSQKLRKPELLEVGFVVESNLILRSLLEKGSGDILRRWHHWLLGRVN
ncbi:MAG: type II/IV secretion system ATPase subunit [Candidatus Hadarchaeales archaeon]